MNTNEDKLSQALYDEIEQRIVQMESNDYLFPKRFSKKDYMVVVLVVVVCLVLIILGAFLQSASPNSACTHIHFRNCMNADERKDFI